MEVARCNEPLIGLHYTFDGPLILLQQAVFVILISIAAVVIVARLALPKGVWDSLLGDLIYDLLKSVVLLPFRIVGRLVSLMAQRGKP